MLYTLEIFSTFSDCFFQIFKHLVSKSAMRGKLVGSLKSTVKTSQTLGISNLSVDFYIYRKKIKKTHQFPSIEISSTNQILSRVIEATPYMSGCVFTQIEVTWLSLFTFWTLGLWSELKSCCKCVRTTSSPSLKCQDYIFTIYPHSPVEMYLEHTFLSLLELYCLLPYMIHN